MSLQKIKWRMVVVVVIDVLEALFKQLEDLSNDDLSVEDDDDGISEEDQVWTGVGSSNWGFGGVDESSGDSLPGSEGYGTDEETDETERSELKNWQLRRLARALKIDRRKTSVSR